MTGYGDSGIDEVAELRLPFGVVAGDAHDVAVVLGDQVGVLVDQRLTHPRRRVPDRRRTRWFSGSGRRSP